tara:strand:- start:408 stop:854 length:447 start_codon:yes stop_codon:yes gene_type:complete
MGRFLMPDGNNNFKIPVCGTHHIAVQSYDWEASLRLYCEVLGMRVVEEFGLPDRKIILLDIGDGSHMEIFAPIEEGASSEVILGDQVPILHFALATTDTRGAIEQVRSAGYEITVEPKEVKLGSLDVTIAFFRGPSGEMVEFFQTNNI